MLLHIKVKPNSKKEELTSEPDGKLCVKIKAPPIDGKANLYLTAYIASFFGLSKSKVRLLKGNASKFKTIEIDAEEAYILERLEQL